MRNTFICLCFAGITAFSIGCGSNSLTEDKVVVEEQVAATEESDEGAERESAVVVDSSEESKELPEESSIEATAIEQEASDVLLYDRKYLEKDGEGYIYRLSDPELIENMMSSTLMHSQV